MVSCRGHARTACRTRRDVDDRPERRGIMSASTACESTIGACTLIANERSHWSTGNSATGANHVHAALLTRMSTGPNSARASSTTRAHASRSRRSATNGTASPPAASMAATVACNEPATRLSPSLRVRATHANAARLRRRGPERSLRRCRDWRRSRSLLCRAVDRS